MKDINVKNQTTQNTDTIKMLDKALAVLDTLRVEPRSLGVNELAKQCTISPSTTFRILQTLKNNGWVFQCRDGRYICGQKISFVMEKTNLNLALKDVSLLIMERYTLRHGQAMNLLIRDGKHCYILQQSRTRNLVDYVPPLYSKLPFHATAGGKILMSELPASLLEQLLCSREMPALTRNTITKSVVYLHELDKVRGQGYAFDNRESAENGSCIAVPVRDDKGNIIAALSFSGFIGIQNIADLLAYLPALQEASVEISRKLYCWSNQN